MDLWFVIKERYILLSVLLIIIFASLFLLFTIWRNQSDIPKSLTVIITIICIGIIVLSIFAFVFSLSFGFNA